jgi:hypothetical protein
VVPSPLDDRLQADGRRGTVGHKASIATGRYGVARQEARMPASHLVQGRNTAAAVAAGGLPYHVRPQKDEQPHPKTGR